MDDQLQLPIDVSSKHLQIHDFKDDSFLGSWQINYQQLQSITWNNFLIYDLYR